MNTAIAIKKENNLSASGKPTLLNKEKRKILIELSKKIVNVEKEKAEYQDHLKTVSKVFYDYLINRFPQEEMEILHKYGKASKQTKVNLCARYENSRTKWLYKVEIPELILTDDHFYIQNSENSNYYVNHEQLNSLTIELFELEEKINKTKKEKLKAYENLILNSKCIEEIAIVWTDVIQCLEAEGENFNYKKIIIDKTIKKEDVEKVVEDVHIRVSKSPTGGE